VDNIKMDLRERNWSCMDWFYLAQDRDQWSALVNTVLNLQVAQNIGKSLSSCTTGVFSRRAQIHVVGRSVSQIKKCQNRLTGPQTNGVTWYWRNVHKEIYDSYFLILLG
jgi:hypothetical protein